MDRIAAWTCALLLACSLQAIAADTDVPRLRQFGVLDGLPSNGVNGIAEDRQGYLWIATRDGLARYDGVGFRTWRVGDGLRDNFVWAVHVDVHDRVWIGTRGAGLSMFDAQRRGFRHFDRASHPAIGSDEIWSIASTRDGALWFGTAEAGVYRLYDGAFKRLLPGIGIVALEVDGDGRLWAGTRDGLFRWTRRGFASAPVPGATRRNVDALAADREGNLWIGLPGKGYVRRADHTIAPMPWRDPVLRVPALHMLLHARDGAHWLDTRSGLARESGGVVRDVPLFSLASRGPVRPAWVAAHEDREGGLWFGSSEAGLWHLPANWRGFRVLTRRVGDASTPGNAIVRGIADAPGDALWLVGNGGVLDRLDVRTGVITHVVAGVCGDAISRAVHATREGVLWIGCLDGIARFDPANGRLRRWTNDARHDPSLPGAIERVAGQPDGTLWFSNGTTLQQRDRSGRVIGFSRGMLRGRMPQGRGALRQLRMTRTGELWIAGEAGLTRWRADLQAFEAVPGAPRYALHGIAFADDGAVWLAGMGTLSVHAWDGRRLKTRAVYGTETGLPMLAPSGIAVDASGAVWLSGARGLVRFDPRRRRARLYGLRDGLPSQDLGDSPLHRSAGGTFAVGTTDGLLLFDPLHMAAQTRMPVLSIASVEVRRGDARVELPRTGTLQLMHDDRDLRVVARLLSFTDAHAHRYRSWLHGYEHGWVASDDGARVFPRLRPGRYTLDVQARRGDGDWSQPRRLALRVQPPWWMTPWAWCAAAVLVLLMLAGLAALYRRRLQRRHALHAARRERALAQEASDAKSRFLATLGHEVRTPMTGVLGMSELLLASPLDAGQRDRVEAIRGAGEHLVRLLDDALDLSRIEAGRLDLLQVPFDLCALLSEIAALAGPLAARRGLAFRCVPCAAPQWRAGDPMRVRQILLNLLGNAIKFTESGHVGLACAASPDGVRFSVSDTGPGLSAAQRSRLFRRFEQADGARTAERYGGSGLGLAICQELAAAMGGRIGVRSVVGDGTTFDVDLPLPPCDAATRAVATPATQASTHVRSVLLVEDDPVVADVLRGLLQARGHRVEHVAHGLQALVEASLRRHDVALVDLDLPGIDGLALAGQLRAHGFGGALVAITARADPDAEPQSRQAGFDAFLRKPVPGAALQRAIDAAVDAKGAPPAH